MIKFGNELMGTFANDVLHGKPPIRWPIGKGWESIRLGPKRIIVIGAPPGTGKTAIVQQWIEDMLANNPNLIVLVVNVEMPPEDLMSRSLARLSGVHNKFIVDREFSPVMVEMIEGGLAKMNSFYGRLAFHVGKNSMDEIGQSIVESKADLIVLDYFQAIAMGGTTDKRTQIDDTLSVIRQAANEHGKCFIVVSSVARDKGTKGRAYENLTLGSFKDSSGFEFNADDAYILSEIENTADCGMMLHHVKSRHSERHDLAMRFDKDCLRFTLGGGA